MELAYQSFPPAFLPRNVMGLLNVWTALAKRTIPYAQKPVLQAKCFVQTRNALPLKENAFYRTDAL
jgi:hypothetical protein